MSKDKTLFDYLNNLYYKSELKYDKKVASAYILSLWLSHDSELIDIVNVINQFHFSISDDLIYKYYYDKVPKGRRYIKWVKKDEADKKIKDRINAFQEEYQVSKLESKQYLWYIKKTDVSKKKKQLENTATKTFFK